MMIPYSFCDLEHGNNCFLNSTPLLQLIFQPGQNFSILAQKLKWVKLITDILQEIFQPVQNFGSSPGKRKWAKLTTDIELQMPPVKLTSKRTIAEITKTPRPPRFKDFDEIEYGDTFPKRWSIHVKVEVKYLPNKYRDNICFILMDKTGAKLEASVWGFAEVERFNRILQPGCNYTIHGVGISHNSEGIEFRHIGHLYECYFDRITVVEPYLPIEFPKIPTHLMPFREVSEHPNKTCVDIIGIVVHCCEREHSGTTYKEAIFVNEWWRRWFWKWRGISDHRGGACKVHDRVQRPQSSSPTMEPIKLGSKRTYADTTETPPDIFLTMTCNPNWQELQDELLPGQTPHDRPDLVARVFRAKLETMKEMLGGLWVHIYVVEFQKNGLPHAHFMLKLPDHI